MLISFGTIPSALGHSEGSPLPNKVREAAKYGETRQETMASILKVSETCRESRPNSTTSSIVMVSLDYRLIQCRAASKDLMLTMAGRLIILMHGVGESNRGHEGYLDWFEIGGFWILDTRIIFADSKVNTSSDKVTAGTIGGEMLMRLGMLGFDHRNNCISISYMD